MFELTDDERDAVVSQNVIPHKKYLSDAKPFAFTETCVVVVSTVFKSLMAIGCHVIAFVHPCIAPKKCVLIRHVR